MSQADWGVRPVRHPDCAYRPIAGEGGLVVIPGRAEVKVMNAIGITVFGLLDGKHTIAEIVHRVTEEYEVAEETARADVEAFLAELLSAGLLAEAGTTGGRPT
jgi:hypothetical protein